MDKNKTVPADKPVEKPDNSVASNYQYWQDNGDKWADEYDHRKQMRVYYHIQELMLADFFTHTAPAQVLEYGCGVGRHLSYLSKIPELEIYGYDQSQTMVDNCLRWCSTEWLKLHVTVGPPVGQLPYSDNQFDVVFTSEVLIHVNPGDLETILSELIRVSRQQILHFEPSFFFEVTANSHDGCWNHDLVAAYHKLGYTCNLLPAGFEIQNPYRVVMPDASPVYSWPPVKLGLLRQLEQSVQPTLNRAAHLDQLTNQLAVEQAEKQALSDQLAVEQTEKLSLNDQLTAEQTEKQALSDQLTAEQTEKLSLNDQLTAEQTEKLSLNDQLAAEQTEKLALQTQLTEVEQRSLAWQAELEKQIEQNAHVVDELEAVTHKNEAARHELALIRQTITWRLRQRVVNTTLGQSVLNFYHRAKSAEKKKLDLTSKKVATATATWSVEELAWLEKAKQEKTKVIAIAHPEWRGILSSTKSLFDCYYCIPDNVDESSAEHYANFFNQTGCSKIVINGFPLTYAYLVKALNKVAPHIKLYVLWHGNWLQAQEDYNMQGFLRTRQFCLDGLIDKWGFVKKGMAEVVAKQTGIRTGFVMNYIQQIPTQASTPLPQGPHIGLFSIGSIWKPPYASIAGATMIPQATLHLSSAHIRIREYMKALNFDNFTAFSQPIPQSDMPAKLAQMHVNLSVTLAECTPMMPLESLAVGCPCLISATSHLFEDHTYLRERLIVPYHERPEIIAAYAEQAIAEREQIVTAYQSYAVEYNEQAGHSVVEFLE